MLFRKFATLGMVCALALTLTPVESLAKSATSGFSRPAAVSRSSGAAAPARSFDAARPAAKSTDGFGAASTRKEADHPTGVLDEAVTKDVSRNAYDKFKAPPAAAQAPNYGQAATPQPSYAPGSYAAHPDYAQYRYANDYRPVWVQGYGYQQPSGGSFSSGMLTGFLLDRLLAPRPSGYDAGYDSQLRDIRRQLNDIAANTSDPAERQRIADHLRQTASVQGQVAGAEQVANPFAPNAAPARPTGHGFLWYLFVVLVLAGVAALVAWKLGLIGGAKAAKPTFAAKQAKKDEDVTMSDAYRPGCRVKIPEIPYLLATGALAQDISGAHSVPEVGKLEIAGKQLERAYFNDGKAFIERTHDPRNPGQLQVVAFNLLTEKFPEDAGEWAFFLGGDGADGSGPCDAYIGLPSIDLSDFGDTSYDRTWGRGDSAVKPVVATETVRTARGESPEREHRMMSYYRSLKTASSSGKKTYEYLYIESVGDRDGASIKVWVGLDVTDQNVEVA